MAVSFRSHRGHQYEGVIYVVTGRAVLTIFGAKSIHITRITLISSWRICGLHTLKCLSKVLAGHTQIQLNEL
jgi:hypothetical protein